MSSKNITEDEDDRGSFEVTNESQEEKESQKKDSINSLNQNGLENYGFTNDDVNEKNENKNESRIENEDHKCHCVGDCKCMHSKGESGEAVDRDEWASPLEFLFSCISMSVGLGNIWRFPFTALENGGGAFLIPYLIVLTLIGRPIYFLELIVGQFSSFGPVKSWEVAPLFRGVGYGSVIGAACITSYYCSIMANIIYYLIRSFANPLPWSICKNYTDDVFCIDNKDILGNRSNAELFYLHDVLEEKKNIDDGIGFPQWKLTLCLLAAWLILLFTLIKGVKSSGKVAYFTAIFPYVVLLILLIRGATLEGSGKGIIYFLKPQWEKLYDLNVWYQAVSQCFFSLGTGMGVIVMFGSYNPFKHNVYRDAMIVSFMDTFTSLFAGITVFSILGYLANEQGEDIEVLATRAGSGLAFISYPEAIALFTWVPQFFAVLFFLMLLTLGVGTAGALTGGVITIISDNFPNIPKWKVTSGVCAAGFLIGLIYVTPGGQFMLNLVDNFGGTSVVYVMAMVEVMAIVWVYGLKNFCNDIEFMLGIKVGFYWKFCWGIFTPGALMIIFLYAMITTKTLKYNGTAYPEIALAFGWILTAFILLTIPLGAFFAIRSIDFKGSVKEKTKMCCCPTNQWGPKHPDMWKKWTDYKTTKSDSYKLGDKLSKLLKK